MAYTVKQLSELSGVSVRTLHYYEEIGLLKPAYHGANGYRYYEEAQLLRLQQILFFKELDFSLRQIQKIVGKRDFDQLAALHSHRKALGQERERLGRLLQTIDETIEHIKGTKQMEDRAFFEGLTAIREVGDPLFPAEQIVLTSLRHPALTEAEAKQRRPQVEERAKRAIALFKEVASCLNAGQKPDSKTVQQLIRQHYQLVDEVHHVSPDVYRALATLYRQHPTYRGQLEQCGTKFPEFMAKAMECYVEHLDSDS